jgi:hypothetical protein
VTCHMTSEAETVTCHITKICRRESDPKTGPGWWVCHECNFVWSDAIAQGYKNWRPKLCLERSARGTQGTAALAALPAQVLTTTSRERMRLHRAAAGAAAKGQ